MKTLLKSIAIVAFVLATCPGIQAQSSNEKVYWMMTATISVNDLPEFHKVNSQDVVPLMAKHGYKQVVIWQTLVGDIEEVVYIAEFDNMNAYHKSRNDLLTSEEWSKVSQKFDNIVKSIKTRFLGTVPYSTMK